MTNATRHPIDYEALNKGDVIPAAQLEEITKTSRDSKNFAFRVLRFKERLERALEDLGRIWTVASIGGDLKILTDAEASTYNYNSSSIARRKERRCFVRISAVDINQLPEAERKDHDRRVEIQGKYIQAQRSVLAEVRLESTKRNAPGLPDGERPPPMPQ